VTLYSVLMGIVASAGALMIFAFFLSLRDRRGGGYVERMAEVEDHRMVTSLSELEMSRPLSERVLIPLKNVIVSAVASRTPASQQQRLRLLVLGAGNPMGLTVATLMIAKLAATAIAGGLVAFLLLPLFKVAFPFNLLGLAAGFLGWILPDQWVKQQAGTRRALLERAIPDTLDLLTICLDAGLAFDAAVNEVATKVPGPMGQELATTMTEVRLGRSRTDALQDMAERVQVEDWSDFIQAIITSRKLGSPISDMVSVQSAEIRRRRRQRSEEKAAQASLKMMFPMIGCIFPTLFIVLMGPVALMLMHPSK
jgi:tight adherence protein C